jgi:hypothetical protein
MASTPVEAELPPPTIQIRRQPDIDDPGTSPKVSSTAEVVAPSEDPQSSAPAEEPFKFAYGGKCLVLPLGLR